MIQRKSILLILLVAVLLLSGCGKSWWPWGKHADMSRATPDGLYQEGVDAYQNADYKKAVQIFQRLKEHLTHCLLIRHLLQKCLHQIYQAQ